MAASDGIHTILSTPHVIPGRTDKNNYLKISSRQDELKQLGQEFDVDIFKGGEVMLNSHFLDTLREGWLPKFITDLISWLNTTFAMTLHFRTWILIRSLN